MPKLIVDTKWMIKTMDGILNDLMDVHITVTGFDTDHSGPGDKSFKIAYDESVKNKDKPIKS